MKKFCFLHMLKTTKLKVSISFFVTLVLLSCSKEIVVNNDNQDCNSQSPFTLIQGQWEWVSSQNFAWSPHFYTPATVGYTMQLNITSDSVFFYKNDSLQTFDVYTLQFGNNDLTNLLSDSTLRFISGNPSDENDGTP